ncbi:MAG: hypothetical protein ABIQ93_15705, partial [Saprospiraceae bacterium]
MKNLFNTEDRKKLIVRLQHLSPDQQRRWGRLSLPQILPHLGRPDPQHPGRKESGGCFYAFSARFRGENDAALRTLVP